MNDIEKLAQSVKRFKESYHNRSFSQRHPELKKIKCPHCSYKHPSPVCIPHYIKLHPGLSRASVNKGRRINPHPNRRGLQLINRTILIYPIYSELEPRNAMKCARAQAGRELRLERKADAKIYKDQQNKSRKINR